MEKNKYITQLKQLIKKYHPDLCKSEYLEKTYNEITIKLNTILNEIRAGKNNSFVNMTNQSYKYYRLGIKYYKNIHPNQFYKRNDDRTYKPKTFEEQLKVLNKIFVSFNNAEFYFTRVMKDYPYSEWADDAKKKIDLLKKLYKSYENMDIEENNQIIDSNKYVKEMGLKII